jgi:hypothetical protein
VRAVPLALVALLAASDVAAAQSAALPRAMHGVWAPEAAHCAEDADVTDSRIEVGAREVGFFASIWTVRSWRRTGVRWRGRAVVAEEGDDRHVPGRQAIALRLLRDGRLEVTREGAEPEAFVRCPAGVRVR